LQDEDEVTLKNQKKQGITITGKGPAVVLLHSSMSSKDQWAALISRHKSRFTFIALDLYGYGDTPFPQDPASFSTRDEVLLIQRTLEQHLEPDAPFHLVGHSFGGAIALKLGRALQNRVMSLTIFEPVAFHLMDRSGNAWKAIEEVATQIEHFLQSKDKVSATRTFIDYWSGKGTFDALHKKNRAMFSHLIDKVALDFKALFNERLTLKDYAKIKLPVCMIKGEKSPAASLEIFETLSRTFTKPLIHTVAGGHMSPITHFGPVNRIISDFLLHLIS